MVERITSQEADDLRRWVVCHDRCADPSMHEFYINGGGFVWRKPRFNFYRTADRHRLSVAFNRYPHCIIGVAVTWRNHCAVLNWKGSPPRRKPPSARSAES